jgi:hypothetical protein
MSAPAVIYISTSSLANQAVMICQVSLGGKLFDFSWLETMGGSWGLDRGWGYLSNGDLLQIAEILPPCGRQNDGWSAVV